MLKAIAHNEKTGERSVIIGLTRANVVKAHEEKKPAWTDLRDVGCPGGAALFVVADTREEWTAQAKRCLDKLEAAGFENVVVFHMDRNRANNLEVNPYINRTPLYPDVEFFLFMGNSEQDILQAFRMQGVDAPVTRYPKDPQAN